MSTTSTHVDNIDTRRQHRHTSTTSTHVDNIDTRRQHRHTSTTSTHVDNVDTCRQHRHTSTTSTRWWQICKAEQTTHTAKLAVQFCPTSRTELFWQIARHDGLEENDTRGNSGRETKQRQTTIKMGEGHYICVWNGDSAL